MRVDAGGYIGRLRRKINVVRLGRNRHVAQDRTDTRLDFGHVAVNACLLARDGVAVDQEEFLFRIGTAKNVD